MIPFAAYTAAETLNHFQLARQPPPPNCPIPWGNLDLHLIHGSWSPNKSTPKSIDQFRHFCTVHQCD